MYEQFIDRAIKVMQLANQEAQRFNHEHVGSEHILLGLVKEGTGLAANVLKNLDIDLRKIRLEVEKIVQAGPQMVTMSKLPQTPHAKSVVEHAKAEALTLGHSNVGTEHLLLGILLVQECVAAQVLMNLGLKLEDVREEVLNLLSHSRQEESSESSWRPPTRRPKNAKRIDFGYEHQLATLPDDLDYIQHLASELAAYCGKREARKDAELFDSRSPLLVEFAGMQLDARFARSLHEELVKLERTLVSILDKADTSDQADALKQQRDRLMEELKGILGDNAGSICAEIGELTKRIDTHLTERCLAVREQDFERAAEARDLQDKMTKARYDRLTELLGHLSGALQVPSIPPQVEPLESVPLSTFSRMHLALFRAELAFEGDSLGRATELIDGVEDTLRQLFKDHLNQVIGQLLQRIDFLDGIIAAESLQTYRTNLAHAQDNAALALKERAALVEQVRIAIRNSVSDHPKLVCKVNVFDFGSRDNVEIRENDTVATLQSFLKEKYADRIEEYLRRLHDRRVPLSEVCIRIYSDCQIGTSVETELSPQTLLAAIPKHDTEGVTWFPELVGADASTYR